MNLNEPFTELSENIFVLHEKMFPLYLIKGEKNVLIDTSITAVQDRICEKLFTLLNKDRLDSILLTHSHYDHTGALPYLQNKFHCCISGSNRTIELLENQSVRDFISDMNKRFNQMLDVETEVTFPRLKGLVSFKEGDRITIDNNRYFEVIETPGHTRCSISFFLLPDRILFPGDAAGVLERNNKNKPLFLSDFNSYISSLKKLINIEASMFCPPHNTYIIGKERVRDHLNRALEAASELKDKILRSLENGMGIAETSKMILEKEFPLPTVQGPKEAFNINLISMVRAVKKSIEEEISEKEN